MDVWKAEEAFGEFGERLAPALKDNDMPDSQPKIYLALNVITD